MHLAITARQALAHLQAGKVTAVEIVQAHLDRIAAVDPQVGAFLHVNASALQQAADIDRRRQNGQPVGPLGGLPVAVKDVLCTIDQPTTCASRMLQHFVPPYNATVIERLRRADAVLIGKTNLDEFAMGGSTENSALGITRNPWNLQCVPGGSSGGAAACVAARMAPLSLGTDTGGSIRQPAAYCGVTGLKPTYGRVSRYGLVAFASSLDQIGPLANTAEDCALLLSVIAGHDPRDATSAPHPLADLPEALQRPLTGLRLGVIEIPDQTAMDRAVTKYLGQAIDVFRALGAEIVPIALPHSRFGIATYYVIAPSEASSNLARYDGIHYGYRTDEEPLRADVARQQAEFEKESHRAVRQAPDSLLVRMYRRTRAEGFGPEVKRRIMLGTYALSAGYYDAYYLKALKVRRLIRQDFDRAFEQVDLLIGPVTPTPAFQRGEKVDDPLAMYLEDLFTVLANLAGIPAISVPCGFSTTGLPVAFQLQGPPFSEATLLQAAHQYQQMTDWHLHQPTIVAEA